MKKFTTLTSHIIPLAIDNVDTDMIIPAQHLKLISKDGYGKNLFSALKQMYPDFVLNKPEYNSGKILVAKDNFGCGSSREHAVWAIAEYGIEAVICSSFSDIFFNNAAKNGLLLITQPLAIIENLLAQAQKVPTLELSIDLEQEKFTYSDQTYRFQYDGFRRHCLLSGLDDLDYLLSHAKEIEIYEEKYCNLGW